MLWQPRSPRPGARGGDTGDPWLPRNQGAIRGEVSGKEKADLRDTMRLGGPPQQIVLKQGTGFKSSAAPEPGPPVTHPCRWHRESSQCVYPLDTRSTELTQSPTGDTGQGSNNHLLAPSRGHPHPVLAEHGLILGEPKVLSTSRGRRCCCEFPALPWCPCFALRM